VGYTGGVVRMPFLFPSFFFEKTKVDQLMGWKSLGKRVMLEGVATEKGCVQDIFLFL
jgi:hypothetical protein